MKRLCLTLSGFIFTLMIGLGLVFAQGASSVQPVTVETPTVASAPVTKDSPKAVKKGAHKNKKHLQRGNKTEGLAQGARGIVRGMRSLRHGETSIRPVDLSLRESSDCPGENRNY